VGVDQARQDGGVRDVLDLIARRDVPLDDAPRADAGDAAVDGHHGPVGHGRRLGGNDPAGAGDRGAVGHAKRPNKARTAQARRLNGRLRAARGIEPRP